MNESPDAPHSDIHSTTHSATPLDWLETSTERLSAGFPEKMVIFDCETTGGKATYHRMTEIALLIIEDGQLIEQWQTLLKPGQHIPPAIQQLTGITPALLKSAPKFADIADELLQKLSGRVLVAHNARFDYGFLKNEFSRVGITYSSKPLCSVKVSRQLFPAYKRHSLNEIMQRFQLQTENRHRALADAQLVWQFLLKTSSLFPADSIASTCASLLKRPALPVLLAASEIDKLPKSPGVYYFYAANDQLLYIGKSVNIRERVLSHFTQDYKNPKDLEMSTQIAHIDFESTPSDFGAQLRESQQIKLLNPHYNRRLKRIVKLYQFQMEADALGYLCIRIRPVENTHDDANLSEQFGLFRSRRMAEARLEKLAEHFFLCHKLCGLQSSEAAAKRTACFGFQLKRCLGACCQQETASGYNERVHIALKDYRVKAWPWPDAILIEEGVANSADKVWHLVHEWRYVRRVRSPDELYDMGFDFAANNGMMVASKEQHPSAPDEPIVSEREPVSFDLDIYTILVRFLLNPAHAQQARLRVRPLRRGQ